MKKSLLIKSMTPIAEARPIEQKADPMTTTTTTPAPADLDLDKLEVLTNAVSAGQWEMVDQGGSIGLRTASGYQCFFNMQRPNAEVEAEARSTAAYVGELKPAVVRQLIALARRAAQPVAPSHWTDERITELSASIASAVAKNASTAHQLCFPHIYLGLKEALATPSPQVAKEADPLDTPLPCDVKIGASTIRKGVRLGVLVLRAQGLHRMLMEYMPKPTPEQRAAFDELLNRGAQPQPEAKGSNQ